MRRETVLPLIVACIAMSVATAAHSGTQADSMAGMKMPGMSMPARETSSAGPARQAYTGNHAFLVKLRSIPHSIPFEKYFTVEFAVYDGRTPTKALPDAHLTVTAGMRHGLAQGLAHGMQSTPRVQANGNLFTVSGLYFHMMGPWTLRVDVERKGKRGTAYFTLPCCSQ